MKRYAFRAAYVLLWKSIKLLSCTPVFHDPTSNDTGTHTHTHTHTDTQPQRHTHTHTQSGRLKDRLTDTQAHTENPTLRDTYRLKQSDTHGHRVSPTLEPDTETIIRHRPRNNQDPCI